MTNSEQPLLRPGAIAAIVGALVSVAAGIGYGALPFGADAEASLRFLAARPAWYWPLVHLGFTLGALLWVGALVALAGSFTAPLASALGRLGVASVVVGAAVHVVNAAVDGFALDALAAAWSAGAVSEQASVVRAADTVLEAVDGTWAMTINLFHGLPFVLFGLAVALDGRYPAWLGWIAVADGAGSLVLGTAMFLGAGREAESLFPPLAVVISAWMVVIGFLMWRRAAAPPHPR